MPDALRNNPAPDLRRRYQASSAVLLYSAITVFVAIGAVNSQNNLLFVALGVAVSAMIVSGLISGAALVSVTITRDPVPAGRAGEAVPVRYTLENRRRVPAFALLITERIEGRSRPIPTASVIMLPGRSAIRVRGSITPDRRGVLRPWIVVGHNTEIRMRRSNATHQRAFASVTITTTAEHAEETIRGEGPQAA